MFRFIVMNYSLFWKFELFFILVMGLGGGSAWATSSSSAPYNQLILNTLKDMPAGGGYDTKAPTLNRLKTAIAFNGESLEVTPEKATPSFCSSATYLVFLKVISLLQKSHQLTLNTETQKELLVKGASEQPDGSGIWGRWNSNGPGTARLFSELKLGRNFRLEKNSEALPGDFMKIFWTDKIGHEERGHSVIFTGFHQSKEGREICFWSSNLASIGLAAGMGTKCVAEKRIYRAIFSRLEFPEKLNKVPQLMTPGTSKYNDAYLEGLTEKSSSPEEMYKKVECH